MEAEDQSPSVWQELYRLARRLTVVASGGGKEIAEMENASELVPRLIDTIGELNLLVADGYRESGEAQIKRLRDLVEVKSAFLRLTTHELRRPIGLASGHLSLIEDGSHGPVPEALQIGLKRIAASIEEMKGLVEGMAVAARMEDRAQAIRLRPCLLSKLVTEALGAISHEAAAKNIRFDPRPSRAEVMVRADPDLLRIAIINLVGNAVKYAPENSTVTIATRSGVEGVVIEVQDQGPGIDPALVGQVFARWQRLPDTNVPGLGLGLYLVRQIIDLHGGTVQLNSRPGEGARFAIVLPQ
jgi:signal transduction histidine kinase